MISVVLFECLIMQEKQNNNMDVVTKLLDTPLKVLSDYLSENNKDFFIDLLKQFRTINTTQNQSLKIKEFVYSAIPDLHKLDTSGVFIQAVTNIATAFECSHYHINNTTLRSVAENTISQWLLKLEGESISSENPNYQCTQNEEHQINAIQNVMNFLNLGEM